MYEFNNKDKYLANNEDVTWEVDVSEFAALRLRKSSKYVALWSKSIGLHSNHNANKHIHVDNQIQDLVDSKEVLLWELNG